MTNSLLPVRCTASTDWTIVRLLESEWYNKKKYNKITRIEKLHMACKAQLISFLSKYCHALTWGGMGVGGWRLNLDISEQVTYLKSYFSTSLVHSSYFMYLLMSITHNSFFSAYSEHLVFNGYYDNMAIKKFWPNIW